MLRFRLESKFPPTHSFSIHFHSETTQNVENWKIENPVLRHPALLRLDCRLHDLRMWGRLPQPEIRSTRSERAVALVGNGVISLSVPLNKFTVAVGFGNWVYVVLWGFGGNPGKRRLGWILVGGARWGFAGLDEDGGPLCGEFVGVVAKGVTHFVADRKVEERGDRHIPRCGELNCADGRVE